MVRWLWKTAALAAAYYLAGKLGLMWAAPSGFAAPVWPAAGIALGGVLIVGARALPGLMLGALLVNLDASLQATPVTTWGSALGLAGSVALGAGLQAFLGALLIRRQVGFPTALTKDRDVVRFLLLGGPLACLVGATWGVTSLAMAGVCSWQQFGFYWGTWWVGDVIGVLIFTPLVLIAFARPRTVWRNRWRSVAIPLLVTFAASAVVFMYAVEQEQRRDKLEFDKRATAVAQRLNETVSDCLDAIESVESLYISSDDVTREDFEIFNARVLARHQAIRTLAWVPRVAHADRDAYEYAARDEGCPEFSFLESRGDGRSVRAAERKEYYPVYFVGPGESDAVEFGLDLSFHATTAGVLQAAADGQRAVATEPIMIADQEYRQPGVYLLKPIYERGRPTSTVAERRENLKGFVLGAFRIGDIVQAALPPDDWRQLELCISDGPDSKCACLFYIGRKGHTCHMDVPLVAPAPTSQLELKTSCDVAGRRWQMRLTPAADFSTGLRSWHAWMVFAGGLLLTTMLGTFLLIQSGKAAEIEELVVARTTELSSTNADLQRQIDHRRRVEAALSQAHEGLERRVEQRTSQLKASEARFQDLYDNAPDMFATVDAKTERIVQCNRMFLMATGYTRQELLGCSIFDVCHPECLHEARTAFDLFVLRGELRDAELQLVTREGDRIDVSLNVSAVRDDRGKIAYLRSIWRDITGRKRAEDKIRQQQADLAHVSRLSMMGEMAAGLAHEINQPLEAIAAYAAGASVRLKNGNANQQRLIQIIDRIGSDAQRAGNVIRRLRRFVRKREPQHSALDINLLVQDVVQFMASDALQDEITVEMNLGDALPRVRGDSVEIQQVVLNLIRNGFDAMFDVEPAHRALGVETCPDGPDAVKVIVRDAGPGIAADSTDQVFAAFFSSKSDGLGMGLAISRSIVESHGGRIWVKSVPGRGAEFHFSLPVADGDLSHA